MLADHEENCGSCLFIQCSPAGEITSSSSLGTNREMVFKAQSWEPRMPIGKDNPAIFIRKIRLKRFLSYIYVSKHVDQEQHFGLKK